MYIYRASRDATELRHHAPCTSCCCEMPAHHLHSIVAIPDQRKPSKEVQFYCHQCPTHESLLIQTLALQTCVTSQVHAQCTHGHGHGHGHGLCILHRTTPGTVILRRVNSSHHHVSRGVSHTPTDAGGSCILHQTTPVKAMLWCEFITWRVPVTVTVTVTV